MSEGADNRTMQTDESLTLLRQGTLLINLALCTFLGAMTSLYLLTSLDVLQSVLGMVSVSEYLAHYEGQLRQLMQTAIGLLSALNLILFIGYMVILVGRRTEENAAIRRLNSELARANDKLSVLNGQLKEYAAKACV